MDQIEGFITTKSAYKIRQEKHLSAFTNMYIYIYIYILFVRHINIKGEVTKSLKIEALHIRLAVLHVPTFASKKIASVIFFFKMKYNFVQARSPTFFPTSSEPISSSQSTDFAPLIVAILRTVSAGRTVGSVVPFANSSLPLLIKEAKYISSTARK